MTETNPHVDYLHDILRGFVKDGNGARATAMHSHKDFLANLTAAPQDVSRPVFEQLIAEGYADTLWNTSASATDAACIARNLERMPLADMIANLQHDAPIYEKTHVGCTCSVTVSGAGKPDVVVNAFGRIG